MEDDLELSLEGGYLWDHYRVLGSYGWTENGETLMASLRWTPWSHFDFWPYLGGSFGYSLNGLTGPINSYEEADGYGGALFIGTGWDLSERYGISFELRYTIASVVVPPLQQPFQVGGLSLLIGPYVIVPRSDDVPSLPE
ncbi:MAG: hypothetical protein ACYCWW_19665 [Deltaproteobacteria bacterium]